MKKLARALEFLLTIFALIVPVYPRTALATDRDVIAQARSAYYSLAKKGFKGFKATLEPNWEVILADAATPENLKVFRAVRFSMAVDPNGTVTVRHEVSGHAAKPELQPVVNKIHYDLQRLVGGVFNTWRMFMMSSPFPETENQIKVENSGKQYRVVHTRQSGEVLILMTSDFLITEWSLAGPRVKRTVKPQFLKTVDGLLLTGYQEVSEPVSDGIKTTLDFNIEYQDVSGMKLPHKVRLSGMHGAEPVAAELVFRITNE